jgi:hypothetical protein
MATYLTFSERYARFAWCHQKKNERRGMFQWRNKIFDLVFEGEIKILDRIIKFIFSKSKVTELASRTLDGKKYMPVCEAISLIVFTVLRGSITISISKVKRTEIFRTKQNHSQEIEKHFKRLSDQLLKYNLYCKVCNGRKIQQVRKAKYV